MAKTGERPSRSAVKAWKPDNLAKSSPLSGPNVSLNLLCLCWTKRRACSQGWGAPSGLEELLLTAPMDVIWGAPSVLLDAKLGVGVEESMGKKQRGLCENL